MDPESETLIPSGGGFDVAPPLKGEGFDASEDGTGRGTPLVAFTAKDNGHDVGEVAPTLRGMGHAGSHANGGGQIAIALSTDITPKHGEVAFTLKQPSPSGGGQPQAVAVDMQNAAEGDLAGAVQAEGQKRGNRGYGVRSGMSVRRLTPRECERLQGFPDDYTLITYRKKPAADGPRYKALGNSMAVPVMAWIGRRIDAVDALPRG